MTNLLKGKGSELDILQQHVALEQAIVGTPLTTGNSVLLLQDGAATYPAMLAAIGGATDHINLESYIVEADGRPAKSEAGSVEASAAQAAEPRPDQRKKVEIDLTVEPSLD